MEENRRVLIVDDNKDIHEDFHKILQSQDSTKDKLSELEEVLFNNTIKAEEEDSFHCDIDDAYQGDEAILMVEKSFRDNKPYAVIFMDVRMPPGINGIETIYKIWRKFPLIEMVICTAYSDYSWDAIVSKLGATDKLLFLKKPFNSVEVKQMTLSLIKKWNLNNQVNSLIQNLEEEVKQRTEQLNNLLVELREKNKVLADLAQRDSLTGLYNHGALYERLDSIYSEARRHEYPLAVVMMDVDDFKKFNDEHGHPFGDEVLKKTADVLKQTLRLYDVSLRIKNSEDDDESADMKSFNVAGRYGGDEFILIIPHCTEEGVRALCQRIHERIQQISIASYTGVKVTVSIGCCSLEKSRDCTETKNLVNLADKALYISKSKGKNQITCLNYDEDI